MRFLNRSVCCWVLLLFLGLNSTKAAVFFTSVQAYEDAGYTTFSTVFDPGASLYVRGSVIMQIVGPTEIAGQIDSATLWGLTLDSSGGSDIVLLSGGNLTSEGTSVGLTSSPGGFAGAGNPSYVHFSFANLTGVIPAGDYTLQITYAVDGQTENMPGPTTVFIEDEMVMTATTTLTLIPEPSSYALFGMGLACVLFLRRRRMAAEAPSASSSR